MYFIGWLDPFGQRNASHTGAPTDTCPTDVERTARASQTCVKPSQSTQSSSSSTPRVGASEEAALAGVVVVFGFTKGGTKGPMKDRKKDPDQTRPR